VEGHGWKGGHVVDEGGGRVSQGCDGVVPVPRVLELVRSRAPVEVEEEIRLGGNFLARYQGGAEW